MNRALACLGTIGMGAVGMYLLDPTWGGRRRNVLRGALLNGVAVSSNGVTSAAREMAHRMESMLADTRARLGRQPSDGDASAEITSGDDSPDAASGRWLEATWSPAIRLVAGGIGAALLGYCVARRDGSTTWLGFIGTGLLIRAASDSGFGTSGLIRD